MNGCQRGELVSQDRRVCGPWFKERERARAREEWNRKESVLSMEEVRTPVAICEMAKGVHVDSWLRLCRHIFVSVSSVQIAYQSASTTEQPAVTWHAVHRSKSFPWATISPLDVSNSTFRGGIKIGSPSYPTPTLAPAPCKYGYATHLLGYPSFAWFRRQHAPSIRSTRPHPKLSTSMARPRVYCSSCQSSLPMLPSQDTLSDNSSTYIMTINPLALHTLLGNHIARAEQYRGRYTLCYKWPMEEERADGGVGLGWVWEEGEG